MQNYRGNLEEVVVTRKHSRSTKVQLLFECIPGGVICM